MEAIIRKDGTWDIKGITPDDVGRMMAGIYFIAGNFEHSPMSAEYRSAFKRFSDMRENARWEVAQS